MDLNILNTYKTNLSFGIGNSFSLAMCLMMLLAAGFHSWVNVAGASLALNW